MAEYNKDESLTQNAMRGVDITVPEPIELPTEIDLSDMELPQALNDMIFEKVAELGGDSFYPKTYGLDIKIVVENIDWGEL